MEHNSIQQEQESTSLMELVRVCIKNWYWFVISAVVCVTIGVFAALCAQPIYNRVAMVLIKETNVHKVSRSDVETMLASAGQGSSKIVNEVVSFKSPALMSEAVRRLGLETEYRLQNRFHDKVLYGVQVPVSVNFDEFPDNIPVSFKILPAGENAFRVSEFTYPKPGERKMVKVPGSFEVAADSVFSTPVGRLSISKGFVPDTNFVWDRPVKVQHITNAAATRKFLSGFDATEAHQKSLCDVLTLSCNDWNPARATDLLNMIIVVYNESWVEDNNKAAVNTSIFIKERLKALESELHSIDETISGYKGENLIPDVGAVSSLMMTQRTDITRQIRELQNQLSISKYMRSVIGSSDGTQLLPTPAGLTNQGLISQVNEYNKNLLLRDNLLAGSSSKNPLIVDMNANLEMLKAAVAASVDNQINAIESQISFLMAQEKENTQQIAASPSQAKDLLSYERQQKVQESIYMLLLQKIEENELSQAFAAYNTRVINPPYGSPSPVSPHKTRMILIAFLIGLFIPFGVIYMGQALNTRVRGRRDLDGMNVPFLGEIPNTDKKQKNAVLKYRLFNKRDDVHELVVKQGGRDVANEAFRVLRTNFEFMNKSNPCVVNMVTSFNPGSGKTFVTLNLTSALAFRDKKVLVIDGDFRRASLSRFFSLNHSSGLSDYLAGDIENLEGCIVQPDKDRSLFVLPVGTIPPNPAELLSTDKFEAVIEELKSKYDYIFMDCAPVDVVADTQIISRVVERCLFVVRCGILERAMLPEIEALYNDSSYRNLSIVLNGTPVTGGKYSYKYGKYSSYYTKA